MATESIKDYLNQLNLDFVKWRYHAAAMSALVVLTAWFAFFVAPGPKWGIDFTGGTEIQMQFQDEVKVDEIRAGLKKLGLSEDSVQQYGDPSQHIFNVRIDDAQYGAEDAKNDVKRRLDEKFGADWVQSVGMDAEVGARISVVYKGDPVSPATVQGLFTDVAGVSVRSGVHDNELVVQLPGLSHQIEERIHTVLPDRQFQVLQSESVGPKVGAELRTQAFVSILATLALVLIYIAFRFDLSFAPGAIVALIHDTSVIAGAFVLFGKEFNLSIIGAILTVIGYSLNDTVVVYDRLRENKEKHPRMPTPQLVNLTVNETLTRTVTTAGATLLAISPFLIIGGPVIGDFSFAMALGIVIGTYSTVYVASPMIMVMEELKPHLQKLIVSLPSAPSPLAAPPAQSAGPTMPHPTQTSAPAARPVGAGPAAPPAPSPGDAPAEPVMTESEKRRRERADRERQALEAQGRGGR